VSDEACLTSMCCLLLKPSIIYQKVKCFSVSISFYYNKQYNYIATWSSCSVRQCTYLTSYNMTCPLFPRDKCWCSAVPAGCNNLMSKSVQRLAIFLHLDLAIIRLQTFYNTYSATGERGGCILVR